MDRAFILSAADRDRVRRLTEESQALSLDPAGCRPLVHVNTPGGQNRFRERWADPRIMLEDGLAAAQTHRRTGDDRLPTLRVELGTGVVASAFGIEVLVKNDSLPCAAEAPARSLADILALPEPDLASGILPRLLAFAEAMVKELPDGYALQLPDTQGVFNTAHLVRGNDILTDFYDEPDLLGQLFARISGAMARIIPEIARRVSPAPAGWFYDWGALWRGTARISNCSMEMISPDFYRQHVRAHDVRLLDALGGGRVHYCGSHTDVLMDFARLPGISGLDFPFERHDFRRVVAEAPAETVLMVGLGDPEGAPARQILAEPPRKRNMIYVVTAEPDRGMKWRRALLAKYGISVR